MHVNSKLLFKKYVTPHLAPRMRVLEIGPQTIPSAYRRLAKAPTLTWETLDIFDQPGLTYQGSDQYSFPIADNTYDAVLSGQVIEHVRKPWVWIKELARVANPGGLVVTICPISWPYHAAPVDCWRIYPEGMRALYEEARLEGSSSHVGVHGKP